MLEAAIVILGPVVPLVEVVALCAQNNPQIRVPKIFDNKAFWEIFTYSEETGRDLFIKGPVKVDPVVGVKRFLTDCAVQRQGCASDPLAILLDQFEFIWWQS